MNPMKTTPPTSADASPTDSVFRPAHVGPVLSAAQSRRFDEKATSQFGIPGLLLMENAARGMVESLLRRGRGPFLVLCGGGNNGGDGLAIARQLDGRGRKVKVVLLADSDRLRGDARANYEMARLARLPVAEVSSLPAGVIPPPFADWLAEAEWVVDALLGTGSKGMPREPVASAIRAVNASGKKVYAVDVPSGLDADRGPPAAPAERETVLKAAATGACGSLKPGLVVPSAAEFVGELEVIHLGTPARLWDSFRPHR